MEASYPLWLGAPFWVTSDSGDRRMQPRRELLLCGIFMPIFAKQALAGSLPMIVKRSDLEVIINNKGDSYE